MNALLTAAHSYPTEHGWPVFPLHPNTKRPGTRHGLKDATTNPTQIETWWTNTPDAGVALPTGPLVGFWVLDIDIKPAEGIDGRDTLADLEAQHGPLPDTLTQLTPSGGEHRLFRWDPARPVRNNQSGLLGPGLDVRGDGGYIVAEPTTLPNGTYEFDAGCDTIADAPDWLYTALTPTASPQRPMTSGPKRSDRPGDQWAAATDWADILTADGWTLSHTTGDGERHWVRPGKDARDGTSATTGYTTNDTLKVFTSSMLHAGLEPDGVYSKLGYLAATRHGGDHAAAASALADAGYGTDTPDADALGLTRLTRTTTPAVPEREPHQWGEPQPLTDTPDLPPWPVHILPAWMRHHIEETADAIQVPVDLCAQFALGALATAAMGYAEVQITDTWSEPLNLYLATIMASGGGKSPAEKAMVKPIREWEADRRTASQADVDQYEVHRRVLEKKAKDAETSASTGSRDITEALADAVAARNAVTDLTPIYPFRRLATDATPERLAELLHQQNGRMALLSAEAPIMDMVAGAYSNLPNIEVYLSGFNGEQIIIDRKGSSGKGPTELIIANPLLTISVAMQPNVLGFATTSNRHAEGRGFFARFMFSTPADMRGQRDHHRMLQPRNTTSAITYSDTLRAIAERCRWPVGTLRLSPEAAKLIVDTNQQRERWCVTEYDAATNWNSKLASTIPRIAALLHVANDRSPLDLIDVAEAEAALELAAYWLAHFLALNPAGDNQTALAPDAQRILDVADRRGLTVCTPRELYLPLRAQWRTVEELVPALQLLADRGWLRLVEGAWEDIGVRGQTVRIEFNATARSRAFRAFDHNQRSTGSEIDHGERTNARNARNGNNGDSDPSSSSVSPIESTDTAEPRKPRVLVPTPDDPDDPDDDFEIDPDLF